MERLSCPSYHRPEEGEGTEYACTDFERLIYKLLNMRAKASTKLASDLLLKFTWEQCGIESPRFSNLTLPWQPRFDFAVFFSEF